MNRKNAVLLLLLASLLIVLAGCSSDQPTSSTPPASAGKVRLVVAQSSSIPDVLETAGTVRAAQTTTLASQVMGNVVELRVREGDRVQRGEILAVIDDSQPRAALDRALAAELAAQQQLVAAETDLALASSTLQRYQSLYERKSVSPQEYDEVNSRRQAALARRDLARAGQDQSKATLAQARTAFDYTRIRAPFDGVITEKKVDLGMLASPGMPLFTVEDVRRYRVEAPLSESDLSNAKVGQAISVFVDALGDAELHGRIGQIVPAADPGSRSFLVKIDLPQDPRLRSGLFGRARFPRGQRTAILIPRNAVVDRGQIQAVFVVDQNKVVALRYVTVGSRDGENVEILAGLQQGESIVATPGSLELDGKRIEAAQ